ncbi:helix-turn-helix domain-containing protein [Porphyromonas sp.]
MRDIRCEAQSLRLMTGDVCRILNIRKRTLQHYRDKDIIPYTQIAGKILYRLSDINRLLQKNYVKRNT